MLITHSSIIIYLSTKDAVTLCWVSQWWISGRVTVLQRNGNNVKSSCTGLLSWDKKVQSSCESADCFFLSSVKISSCTVWAQELVIIYLLSRQSWWAEFSSGSRLSLGALGAILSPWPLCARFTLDEKQTATLHLLLCVSQTFLCKR